MPCGRFRSFLFPDPLRLPAQPSPKEDLVADWRAKLQRQEERLRRQEWKAVAKDSRDLVAEMVDRLLIGEASAAVLALAVGQQAVAEFALGNREEAVWLLHLAQNLDARYCDVTLGSYGPAGEELERFRLRPLGAASAAWPKLPAEGSFEPPRVLRQKEPETPGALARARVVADVEVEMVVGPDGRVVEPVLLTEPEFPSLAFVVLESLRGWRFEPARASGTAVPALFRTRISHERLQKAAEASSSDRFSMESLRVIKMRLESFDARLRRGEGQAVHAAVQEMVDGFRASAYGSAGALLEESNPWRLSEEVFRVGSSPSSWEETVVRPEKISGRQPEYPTGDRLARVQGTIVTEMVIEKDGRITQPRLLKGLSPGLDLKTLVTLCDWRFKPATLGGRPVKVYYSLTTNFEVFSR